jgi:hypothetical protein
VNFNTYTIQRTQKTHFNGPKNAQGKTAGASKITDRFTTTQNKITREQKEKFRERTAK